MSLIRGLAVITLLACIIGCAPKLTTVTEGTKVVCEDCGKVLSDQTRVVEVPVKEANRHVVVIKEEVCEECRQKREEAERQRLRQEKIDAFVGCFGPINIVTETDSSGGKKEFVVYIDGIFGERKKVPMEVVQALENPWDLDNEKYQTRGPMSLSGIYAGPNAPEVWITWVNVTTVIGGSDYAEAYIANTTDHLVRRAVVEIDHYDDEELKRTDTIDFLAGQTLAPHTLKRFRRYVEETPGLQYNYRFVEGG
jgi:hypothetical protein